MSNPGEHVQTPTSADSITSTIVGMSSRLPLSVDTKIEGLPSGGGTHDFGFDKHGVAHDTNDGEIPAVIPPTHTNRTLVVCFDGTGDQFDNDNSNIVQLVNLMKKGDRRQQLVYYQVRAFPVPAAKRSYIAP